MDIAVIGAGYVGLVTAAGLASLGHRIRVGEADPTRLSELNAGRLPIYEPGLEELVEEAVAKGRLEFFADNREAATGVGMVFLTLPTPTGDDGHADIGAVEQVVAELGGHLAEGCLLVVKSTVPVGSAHRFQATIDRLQPGIPVVSHPEFFREGSAVHDFFHPDRIVIGADVPGTAAAVGALYEALDAPVLMMDPVSAEMVKYGSNAFLAARITFANTLANVCEAVGADADAVLAAIGSDERIGRHFLKPGPGFGGSCFPKDTRALISLSEAAGYDFQLLKAVVEADQEHRRLVGEKIRWAVGGDLGEKNVGLWGLAFKAGTDDTRHSPALDLARSVLAGGAQVRAYDPQAACAIPGIVCVDSALEAAKDADVLVVATEWPEFAGIDFRQVAETMRGDCVIDARNLLDPQTVVQAGLRYQGVGRRSR